MGESIEDKAEEVLKSTGYFTAPVPVDIVARKCGVGVQPTTLGEHVSGLLVVQGSGGLIGYNESHPLVRQRFTIAHELGHYFLHRGGGDLLFIDKGYRVFSRDQSSSRGENQKEIEANRFAAALLMPRPLVETELTKIDLGDDSDLQALADRFKVSLQSMSIKLANIGVLRDST